MFRSSYGKDPTSTELSEYMNSNGLNSSCLLGWEYFLPENKYIARKSSVLMDSGNRVDIIIKKDLSFDVLSR
jgi:hypothetical protein